MNAGRRDRCNRDIDAGIIHERQRARLVPGRWRDAAHGMLAFIGLPPEKIRKNVVMNVDGERHVVRF
jgi:hypothetical protein